MRMISRSLIAVSAVVLAGAALPAPAQGASRVPSALLPLSDKDIASSQETGCQFSFTRASDTYLFVIGNDFLMRTASGFALCRITDAQYMSLGSGSGGVSCAGRRMVIRRTGKRISYRDTDSSEAPAALTMTQRGRSRTMRGTWNTAC